MALCQVYNRQSYSLSFWRTLQKRRNPEAFDNRLNFESVLAFRKPSQSLDGDGAPGIAAVITSPPYEGSASAGPSGIDWTKQADGRKKQEPHGVGAHPWGYTRRGVDLVLTSPPFAGTSGGHGTASSEPINAKYPGLFQRHLGGNIGGATPGLPYPRGTRRC